MGCDLSSSPSTSNPCTISIHAPTWGATPLREHHPDEVDISIHAPMWGATRKPGDGDRSGEISIHAPTCGATHRCRSCHHGNGYFNPRTHVGCDLNGKWNLIDTQDFNPRTHVGCDGIDIFNYTTFYISIHAPTWGATSDTVKPDDTSSISIHAPTWGATLEPRRRVHAQNISIHAPTWGATGKKSGKKTQKRDFNPRTHVGCDPAVSGTRRPISPYFNPRTHVGCDDFYL